MDTTTASVNSALQRARRIVSEKVPARTQQQTLRELDDARQREIVAEYSAALERGDADALVAPQPCPLTAAGRREVWSDSYRWCRCGSTPNKSGHLREIRQAVGAPASRRRGCLNRPPSDALAWDSPSPWIPHAAAAVRRWDLPRMVVTAMVAMRRNALIAVGGFEPGFGEGWGADDTFLGAKLIAAGHKVVPLRRAVGATSTRRTRRRRPAGEASAVAGQPGPLLAAGHRTCPQPQGGWFRRHTNTLLRDSERLA